MTALNGIRFAAGLLTVVVPSATTPVVARDFASCFQVGQRINAMSSEVNRMKTLGHSCSFMPNLAYDGSRKEEVRERQWYQSAHGQNCSQAFQICTRLGLAEAVHVCDQFLSSGRGSSEQLSLANQIYAFLDGAYRSCPAQ